MPAFIDNTGLTFGRLTVLGQAPKNKNRVRWQCRCACGTKIIVLSKYLRNGDTKSCGCLKPDILHQRNFKHGHTNKGQWSRTYTSWTGMFGGAVEVCERWRSFENFLADMGERPKGLTLSRINKKQGYFPANCKWSNRLLQARFTDLTNQRFNRLTVLGISHRMKAGQRERIVWRCRCDCGTETRTATTADLRNGNTQSCGCFLIDTMRQRRTHGHTAGGKWSTTFQAWQGALTRCYNPNTKSYKHYGARGITVCERWRHSFENFLADMGEKPKDLTLGRIDNDGPYAPNNCRWETYSEQNKNRRHWDRKAARAKSRGSSPR